MQKREKIIEEINSVLNSDGIKEELQSDSIDIENIILNSKLKTLLSNLFHNTKGVIEQRELDSFGENEILQKVLKSYLDMKEITILAQEELEDNDIEEDIDNIKKYNNSLNDYYDVDITKSYLRQIGKIPLLTKEEEYNLILEKEAGNEEARKKLVEHNLRLVVSIAKKYQGRGLQLLELIQEGSLGLMKAIDKFDRSFGCKLSTYATSWIRQAIDIAIKNTARSIRIPVYMEEANFKLEVARRKLQATSSEEVTIEQLSQATGFTEDKIKTLITYSRPLVSLDKPVDEEENSQLSDFIASDMDTLLEKEIMDDQLRINTAKILKSLTSREKQVIMMRAGLDNYHSMTLEEVGNELHITRERVRQIEAKALRKLRHPRNTRAIKDFVE